MVIDNTIPQKKPISSETVNIDKNNYAKERKWQQEKKQQTKEQKKKIAEKHKERAAEKERKPKKEQNTDRKEKTTRKKWSIRENTLLVSKVAAEELEGGKELSETIDSILKVTDVTVETAKIIIGSGIKATKKYQYMKNAIKKNETPASNKKFYNNKNFDIPSSLEKEEKKKKEKFTKSNKKSSNVEKKQKSNLRRDISHANVKKRMLLFLKSNTTSEKNSNLKNMVKDIAKEKVAASVKKIVQKVALWILGVFFQLFFLLFPIFIIIYAIYASPFAILLPELEQEGNSIQAVLKEKQLSFRQEIEEEAKESDLVTTHVIYNGIEADGDYNNYYDMLATYCVKYNNGEMELLIAEKNQEKVDKIFEDMCYYTVKRTVKPIISESGLVFNEITKKIVVYQKSYADLINENYFTEGEIELINELMKPENLLAAKEVNSNITVPGISNTDMIEINKHLTPGQKGSEAVRVALTKVGAIYSQARRYEEGYYDCSSLTYRVYLEVGIDLNYKGTNVASYQARKMVAENRVIAYEDLAPGDLIFWSNEPCDSYLSITHVGLYAGNGKTIEASYSKGRVVYRNIWGVNEIVLCARPY